MDSEAVALANAYLNTPTKRKRKQPIAAPTGTGPGLSGERGLIVGVIARAVNDYFDPKEHESAAAYFRSDEYRAHLAWLGLPPDWMPVHLESGIS